MRVPQIVITAAGLDDDPFINAGFEHPKNLVMISDSSILETAVNTYRSLNEKPHIIIRNTEDEAWGTGIQLKKAFPKATIQKIRNTTQGALCTALMSIGILDYERPLLICPGDSTLNIDTRGLYEHFIESGATASTLIFQSSNPRYSYARLENNSQIIEMAEKKVISDHASTGVFMFRKASDFIRAAEWVLLNNMSHNGEFFISSTLNYLVMQGEPVIGIQIGDRRFYIPMSKPVDLIKE